MTHTQTQGADGAGTSRDSFPERRGDWMQTFTGRRFWPLDPRPEDVCIEDIAHALALQTRFGGHCLRFYSVAEHCVHLARATPPEHALWALLHDASEAYIADIVRPLKRHLDGYGAAEIKVTGCVCETFDLDGFMPEGVKALDNRILMDERAQVMLSTGEAWHYGGATEPLGVTLQFWTPEQAEREFLTTFAALTGRQVALPALASPRADSAERTANVAQALRSADWGGVSIGNKALIAAAISELEATPAPAATPGVPDSLRALSEAATPGEWGIWAEPIGSADDAVRELASQVAQTDPLGGTLYLLSADGKCPATTGCGPTSWANANLIVAAVNHVRVLIATQPAGQAGDAGASPVRAALEASMDARGANRQQAFFREAAARIAPAPNSTRTGAAEIIARAAYARICRHDSKEGWQEAGDDFDRREEDGGCYANALELALAIGADAAAILAARPEAPSDAGIAVDVQTVRTSAGADYYVRFTCGGREVTPYMFKERYKAEYEAAHFAWIFGLRPDEPDLMAYDEASHPNAPTPPSDPAPSGRAEG